MARERGLTGAALAALLAEDLEWCKWELGRVVGEIEELDPVRDRGRLLERDRRRWASRIRRVEHALLEIEQDRISKQSQP